MKNITKVISALAFCTLLGASALNAQSCTVVFKPNAASDGNLYIDQSVLFSTALASCNTAGHISQIVIKYHNSFYNNNSPALQSLQVNIKQADNSILQLAPSQDSVVKGAIINGPAQSFTATLTFTGSLPQYLPNDQSVEVKAIAYSGSTTSPLNNWIDEIDIVTTP